MHDHPPIDFSVDNGRGGWVPYHYYPSVPAAATFGTIFLLAGLFHIWRLFKYKGWYFIPFIIGVFFEVVGYYARIGSHYDFYSLKFFIMQSLLILLAPALFAASVYMTLSRIAIALHSEHLLFIKPRWLTTFFVTGDVLSFLTQMSGGGLQAAGNSDMYNTGKTLITAGLFIQIFFFTGFIAVSTLWHRRLHRTQRRDAVKGRKYIYTMYAVGILILIRSVFRVIEYLMPKDNVLLVNEPYLYVFDATLMALSVILYIIVKPYGDLFNEWKRRKDLGDLEISRRDANNSVEITDLETSERSVESAIPLSPDRRKSHQFGKRTLRK